MNWIDRGVSFVTDATPEGLQEKLFRVNILTGKMTDIISIQKVGNLWYAWYYKTRDKDVVNGK